MATKSPIDFGNIQGNSTISKGGNLWINFANQTRDVIYTNEYC